MLLSISIGVKPTLTPTPSSAIDYAADLPPNALIMEQSVSRLSYDAIITEDGYNILTEETN